MKPVFWVFSVVGVEWSGVYFTCLTDASPWTYQQRVKNYEAISQNVDACAAAYPSHLRMRTGQKSIRDFDGDQRVQQCRGGRKKRVGAAY